MKALVLNGSPKAKSDTMHMTNAFIMGIKETGEHQIEIINVIECVYSNCKSECRTINQAKF